MSPVRAHEHRCRTCHFVWWCTNASCGRTGMRRDCYCHGQSCNQAVQLKKDALEKKRKKPSAQRQPKLFEGDQ